MARKFDPQEAQRLEASLNDEVVKMMIDKVTASHHSQWEDTEEAAKPVPNPQVQVEQIKADLQLKEKELMLRHQYETEKLKQDYKLKVLELRLKFGGANGAQV